MWAPQGQKVRNSTCAHVADADGNGIININDVITVFMNNGKTHTTASYLDCAVVSRQENMELYYSIFQSLPDGEFKQSLAEKYGFTMLPQAFHVYPNYPNPFNPITEIKYEISERGDLVINIFNLQGQEVEKHYIDNLHPGYYTFIWNASKYSTGIYFCKMFFNNDLIGSNKMLFIK